MNTGETLGTREVGSARKLCEARLMVGDGDIAYIHRRKFIYLLIDLGIIFGQIPFYLFASRYNVKKYLLKVCIIIIKLKTKLHEFSFDCEKYLQCGLRKPMSTTVLKN